MKKAIKKATAKSTPVGAKSTKPIGVRRAVEQIKTKYNSGPDSYDLRNGKKNYVSSFQDVVSESSLSGKFDSRTLSAAARRVAEDRWNKAAGVKKVSPPKNTRR
jgi:hypothetical protein